MAFRALVTFFWITSTSSKRSPFNAIFTVLENERGLFWRIGWGYIIITDRGPKIMCGVEKCSAFFFSSHFQLMIFGFSITESNKVMKLMSWSLVDFYLRFCFGILNFFTHFSLLNQSPDNRQENLYAAIWVFLFVESYFWN